MQDEMTLTLNSPITEEQWDDIMDVDFDHTDRIMFHTKHGKEVEFVKRKNGHWLLFGDSYMEFCKCSNCGHSEDSRKNFCPECGADMRGGQDEWVLRG